MELSFLLVLLGAYLLGAIPTGVILTRLAGIGDVRQAGSGNIGATNVYRVAGRGLGLLTLLGDALKGVIPLLLVIHLLQSQPWQVGAVAVAAFLGHCFPVYLGFKGGKGVATALGIFLVLSPLSVLVALIVFALLLWKWRYVSLGSVAAALLIPFLVLLFEASWPLFVATLAISALVILRHRANIERLLAGTENRFNF
jgi:acyl phosphate:glycerol-3-phosphate acyltransferase